MTTADSERESPAHWEPQYERLALYSAAVTAGVGAYALVIQWQPFVWIVAATAILSSMIVTGQTSAPQVRPGGLELKLSLLGASGIGMICSVLGIFLYLVLQTLSAAFRLLLGVPFLLDQGGPIWLSAVAVIFLVVAMTASDAPVYLQKLSVPATEPSSPFFALAQHPHRLQRTLRGAAFGGAAAVLLTLLLLVGLWVGLPPWLDSYALGWLILPAALFWMTLTQQLWEVKRSVPHPVRNQRLVGKIRSLMEAAGYRVVIYPSTSDPDLAPLVALLDFMAVRPDRILAGQVRETIDWNPLSRELTSLQPAAAALEDELSKTRDVEVDVEAVLVVVGARRPADWPRASGYRVIEAPVEAEIDALLSDPDVERKARRAMLLCDGAPRASAASVEAVSLESWPT